MADVNLDPRKSALFIGDFYADMMGSLAHATDRNVIQNTSQLRRDTTMATPADYVNGLRARIHCEVGVPVSAGLSSP